MQVTFKQSRTSINNYNNSNNSNNCNKIKMCDQWQHINCFIGPIEFKKKNQFGREGHRGDTTDDSTKLLFQTFLQKAFVSSSGMGRDIRSMMLSFHHFLCRPRRRLPCKVSWRMVLERPPFCVTCSNPASFRQIVWWIRFFVQHVKIQLLTKYVLSSQDCCLCRCKMATWGA